ncbi:MAG: fused response regulator/phosphatase [Mycobacteriaceae bacterium]|nr:fused response regulator/phosphatase [Mycobacteriaceae bacterium]
MRASPAAAPHPLSLLLVEDDRADALLVEELIVDTGIDIGLVWTRTIADGEREMKAGRPDCVLLDLNLPDVSGMDALDRVTACDNTVPIVVLTGLNDEPFGVSAVGSGAQDYLVKGRVDAEMLRRSLLYAIERKRAEITAVDLSVSQLRAQENARLERGLLPAPLLLEKPGVEIVTQYRPGRSNALLGGDFYDVVQTPDRTVHVVVGDVAGHGPDAAAVGVALRIAWRTLALTGVDGADRMRALERILHAERGGTGIFVTMISLAISPESGHITAVRAGHPGMLVHDSHTVEWLVPAGGPALGLHLTDWPEEQLELPERTGLLLLTDGLFEGHSGDGDERLGEEGVLELARSLPVLPAAAFVGALIDAAENRAATHGGLSDDVAVVRVERRSP